MDPAWCSGQEHASGFYFVTLWNLCVRLLPASLEECQKMNPRHQTVGLGPGCSGVAWLVQDILLFGEIDLVNAAGLWLGK